MTALEVLNRYRLGAGRAALTPDLEWVLWAMDRAAMLATQGFTEHDPAAPASEVLTVGQLDEAGVIWEWLNWPAHRGIILDPNARRAGFGHALANGQTYWVGLIGE